MCGGGDEVTYQQRKYNHVELQRAVQRLSNEHWLMAIEISKAV